MTLREWKTHPALQGRFHPDAPEDVQVLVHDGGPSTTPRTPEIVWVRVHSVTPGDVFHGTVLNAPVQLQSVTQGGRIAFVATESEHLLMVTPEYLAERDSWDVQPCSACGFDELFDPPSSLARASFDNLDDLEAIEAFTTRCALCGGTQIVAVREDGEDSPPVAKWWQFWR